VACWFKGAGCDKRSCLWACAPPSRCGTTGELPPAADAEKAIVVADEMDWLSGAPHEASSWRFDVEFREVEASSSWSSDEMDLLEMWSSAPSTAYTDTS
jgi:hypothetical protein